MHLHCWHLSQNRDSVAQAGLWWWCGHWMLLPTQVSCHSVHKKRSRMIQEGRASKDSYSWLPAINTKQGACSVELVTVQCIHAPLKHLCNPKFTFAVVFTWFPPFSNHAHSLPARHLHHSTYLSVHTHLLLHNARTQLGLNIMTPVNSFPLNLCLLLQHVSY